MNYKKTLKQFTTFLGVGIIGTILDYLIFFLSTLFCNYLIAGINGNIVGALFNYVFNKKLTFKNTKKNNVKLISKYVASVFLYMTGTFLLMYLLVDLITINKFVSKIFVVGVMFIINFLINKYLVFK